MYISPSDIRQSRLETLDNLHLATQAWMDASCKLSELAVKAGRQALDEGRARLEELASRSSFHFEPLPLEKLNLWRDDSAALVQECMAIASDAHQALLKLVQEQVSVFDKVLLRQMDRAALSADSTGEAAIGHVKTAIRQAEKGLKELTDAAAQSADMVEAQIRQASEALISTPDEAPPAAPPAPRRRRTAAPKE